jgi:hypothetical protein
VPTQRAGVRGSGHCHLEEWALTPPSSGHATASRVMPLMSNVGRHGNSHLSSKRRCISHCSRFAPMPALARAVRPLAAGEPQRRLHQVRTARLGCPSCGGQRAARSVQAKHSLGNTRVCSDASPRHAGASARCRSEESQSTLLAMSVAAASNSRAKARSLLGAAVPLFFACRPTPPSSGQPSAAAHVER